MPSLKLLARSVLAAACVIAQCTIAVVHAQNDVQYPRRPVRLIVPASTGSGMDYMGRAVAQSLSDKYKQQVIVDNRAGAGSLIGSGVVAAATPDGYTLGVASTSTQVAPLLQSKPPYRPLEDFAPIVLLSSITSILVVAPGVPAKTAAEFIALLKSHPGQFNFASIGAGSASHLTAEIFNRVAGIDAVHVPFKTVPDVYTEMLASRVHYLIWISPSSLPMVRDGKLRALAVTSARRAAALPDVHTVGEAGLKGAEVDTMIGIVGPATLSKAMIARIHDDVQDVLKRPEIRVTFDRQGGEPAIDVSTAAYAEKWRNEYQRYRKLLPEIGLKPQ